MGLDHGKASGYAESSLDKFSQMTHFPRTESLNGKRDVGVLSLALNLIVVSDIWERDFFFFC